MNARINTLPFNAQAAMSGDAWLQMVCDSAHPTTPQLIAQRQDEEGTWAEASSLQDHMGITYALLLSAQQPEYQSHEISTATAHACHRAIAYLFEQLRRWSLLDSANEPLHALSLLVLVKYINQYPGAGASTPLKNLMTLLTRQLSTVAAQGHASTPWAQLALDAYHHHSDLDAGSNWSFITRQYNGKWLASGMLQLQITSTKRNQHMPAVEPWIAIAMLECAQQHGQLQFSSDAAKAQFQAGMQEIAFACATTNAYGSSDCRTSSNALIKTAVAQSFAITSTSLQALH